MIKNITISPIFKKSAVKAILAILFFLLVYTLIVLLAIALTIACGYAGIFLVTSTFSVPALLGGAGLISFGLLILIFTIKFLFKKHVVDRSHLLEISHAEQPELFAFIDEVVTETGTNFPKKVFLSAEVNASVFYDSDVRSMFFPVRKNLNIGMGLVNVVNKSELKAILAHEFGHFSQRSMTIGSYVYNVNQVIYNMLYDNQGYSDLIGHWSGMSNYFSFFVGIAVKVIRGIQWILQKVYQVVNLNYMSLSRAMEFHADEVAAHAAGSEPLMSSLQRLDLANFSYNTVLRFYGNHIDDNLRAADLYAQQRFVMLFQARQTRIPLRNGLPHLTGEDLIRFNRSKLVIRNQWASHPETDERVANLRRLNIACKRYDALPAMSMINRSETIRKHFSKEAFQQFPFTAPPGEMSLQAFEAAYETEFHQSGFDAVYNGFYDHRNPQPFDTTFEHPYPAAWKFMKPETVFTAELTELAYESRGLETDIQVLEDIASGTLKIKSFDYDGEKYYARQSASLVLRLKEELDTRQELLRCKDTDIYAYFHEQARNLCRQEELERRYNMLFHMDNAYEQLKDVYEETAGRTRFIQVQNSYNDIQLYLEDLKEAEKKLKEKIRMILQQPAYAEALTTEVRSDFEKYLYATGTYFDGNRYNDASLDILFAALNQFGMITTNSFFFCKKSLLTFQKELFYPSDYSDQKDSIVHTAG